MEQNLCMEKSFWGVWKCNLLSYSYCSLWLYAVHTHSLWLLYLNWKFLVVRSYPLLPLSAVWNCRGGEGNMFLVDSIIRHNWLYSFDSRNPASWLLCLKLAYKTVCSWFLPTERSNDMGTHFWSSAVLKVYFHCWIYWSCSLISPSSLPFIAWDTKGEAATGRSLFMCFQQLTVGFVFLVLLAPGSEDCREWKLNLMLRNGGECPAHLQRSEDPASVVTKLFFALTGQIRKD